MPGTRSFVAATTVALAFAAGPARANDFAPNDFRPAAAGSNVALVQYVYRHFDARDVNGRTTGTTDAAQHIATLQYGHYGEVWDHTYAFSLKLPYIGLSNAEIAGTALRGASGFGDPIAVAAFWPLNQPEAGRYVAIASFTSIPLGTYEPGRTLNPGAHRWQEDLQVDFHQELPFGFSTDIAGDVISYGTNDAAGTGSGHLTQRPTWQVYGWLSYKVTPTVFAALGYAGSFGGRQFLNGRFSGVATTEDLLQAALGWTFKPGWQLLVGGFHDIAVKNGLEQDYATVIRLAHRF